LKKPGSPTGGGVGIVAALAVPTGAAMASALTTVAITRRWVRLNMMSLPVASWAA
jgi:hypothetical protein